MNGEEPDLDRLEERLGFKFRDRALVRRALSHRSFVHEHGDTTDSNETLEFLGDALLGFLVAEMIASRPGLKDEGEMSKAKSRLVSEDVLAELARNLGLGSFILLSRGEEKTGGRSKPSLLADTLEAVLAATYLDRGMDGARDLVRREMAELVERLCQPGVTEDPKSALQELCHQRSLPQPRYRLCDTQGPDHRPLFVVECQVGEEIRTRGTGPSKKDAERAAARDALAELGA